MLFYIYTQMDTLFDGSPAPPSPYTLSHTHKSAEIETPGEGTEHLLHVQKKYFFSLVSSLSFSIRTGDGVPARYI